jgi:hypothetical protein
MLWSVLSDSVAWTVSTSFSKIPSFRLIHKWEQARGPNLSNEQEEQENATEGEISFLSMAPLDRDRFSSFLILYTVGMTPWTGDQPVVRSLPTRQQKHRINGQPSMPRMEFEPTIPMF